MPKWWPWDSNPGPHLLVVTFQYINFWHIDMKEKYAPCEEIGYFSCQAFIKSSRSLMDIVIGWLLLSQPTFQGQFIIFWWIFNPKLKLSLNYTMMYELALVLVWSWSWFLVPVDIFPGLSDRLALVLVLVVVLNLLLMVMMTQCWYLSLFFRSLSGLCLSHGMCFEFNFSLGL